MQEILLSIDNNIYLALSIALITCLVIFSISYLLHSYEKRKRSESFAKFAEIEKKQKAEDFDELVSNYKLLLSNHLVSNEAIESLTDECYTLICRNTELMKAFEEAAMEIKVLQSKCILMEEINTTLRKRLSRPNAKRDEKGRFIKAGTVKEIESEYWECLTDQYPDEYFQKGQTYQFSKRLNSLCDETLLSLIAENKVGCLVYKKDFKPVQK